MLKLLTFTFAFPMVLGFYEAFEEGSSLDQIATEISLVAQVDSGSAFDLGGGKTVSDALDSCLFRYSNCQEF